MSLERIRNYYKVPAKRGKRIVYKGDGSDKHGTIIGSRDQYIRVRLDGQKKPVTLHPTWEIDYLTPPTNQ